MTMPMKMPMTMTMTMSMTRPMTMTNANFRHEKCQIGNAMQTSVFASIKREIYNLKRIIARESSNVFPFPSY